MIQTVLIVFIFAAAVTYLGRMVYRSFQAKNACATGCAKCSVAEVDKKTA